jgi:hypothetical protein
MAKEQRYFSIITKIFWGLILVLALFALLNLNPQIFRGEHIAQSIILEDSLAEIDWSEKNRDDDSQETEEDDDEDTNTDDLSEDEEDDSNDLSQDKKDEKNKKKNNKNKKESDSCINREWQWKSFDGKTYTLKFRILQSDYNNAKENRENCELPNRSIWSNMYHNDRVGLQEMVEAYRKIITDNQLTGMDALNMVASSVQHKPYVLVTNENCPSFAFGQRFTNNCQPIENSPSGCCGFVMPFAVYSPIEYAVNACGDCDTKALFACTILKELKLPFYRAEMLTGGTESGPHAMLGLYVINPPYNSLFTKDIQQNKYYAWEVTAPGFELGQNVWKSWTNWTVVKL